VPAASQFHTWASLATLAGASALTLIITNTLRYIFNLPNARWLGLLVAEVVSLASAYYMAYSKSHNSGDLVIAFLNGFLIFATALGGSHLGDARPGKGSGPAAPANFWRKW